VNHVQKISISRQSKVWIGLFFLVGIIYFGFPVYWIAMSTTKIYGDFDTTNALWFGSSIHPLQNIHQLFTGYGGIYARWFANSLLYSGTSSLVIVFVSALGGYGLSKLIKRGANFVGAATISMIMVPANTLVVPLFILFARVNLNGTIWSVILPALPSPLGLFLVKYYIDRNVSDEILSAARLDKASEFQVFRKVVLPIIKPMLGTVFLISFVTISNSYFLPQIMLNEPKLYPTTVGMANWFGGQFQIIGIFTAILPSVIAFFYLQRNWHTGLIEGESR
jgi:multiple sugar transport system permease protein